MPSAINKVVLIIGATSGIGEGLTRRIHAQGKKVIAAGRREDRLRLLEKELPGLCTVCLDISDIGNLPTVLSTILQDHPDLDTVIVSAGIQSYFSIKEGHLSSPSKIQSEFDINLTGPAVLSHLLIPHFLQREDDNNPSTICFIGSGLAFVPLPLMPIYCASKAGLHSLCVSLRAELDGTHVNIVEICPPYVETELDKSFRDEMIARLGGPEKAPKPMSVSQFLDNAMEGLLVGRSEIGVGFGQAAFDTWRKAFSPFLERFHVNG
ncbi:putative oxidoreductase DltE [Talaromyces pinophilus]|jgi:short-subunit dehydrogenase involved in D-alanine esterification of teichoic acids|nr:putative oxidoreductase DltE [Talaromyces pinophilus]